MFGQLYSNKSPITQFSRGMTPQDKQDGSFSLNYSNETIPSRYITTPFRDMNTGGDNNNMLGLHNFPANLIEISPALGLPGKNQGEMINIAEFMKQHQRVQAENSASEGNNRVFLKSIMTNLNHILSTDGRETADDSEEKKMILSQLLTKLQTVDSKLKYDESQLMNRPSQDVSQGSSRADIRDNTRDLAYSDQKGDPEFGRGRYGAPKRPKIYEKLGKSKERTPRTDIFPDAPFPNIQRIDRNLIPMSVEMPAGGTKRVESIPSDKETVASNSQKSATGGNNHFVLDLDDLRTGRGDLQLIPVDGGYAGSQDADDDEPVEEFDDEGAPLEPLLDYAMPTGNVRKMPAITEDQLCSGVGSFSYEANILAKQPAIVKMGGHEHFMKAAFNPKLLTTPYYGDDEGPKRDWPPIAEKPDDNHNRLLSTINEEDSQDNINISSCYPSDKKHGVPACIPEIAEGLQENDTEEDAEQHVPVKILPEQVNTEQNVRSPRKETSPERPHETKSETLMGSGSVILAEAKSPTASKSTRYDILRSPQLTSATQVGPRHPM
jgi:hypothetical protein